MKILVTVFISCDQQMNSKEVPLIKACDGFGKVHEAVNTIIHNGMVLTVHVLEEICAYIPVSVCWLEFKMNLSPGIEPQWPDLEGISGSSFI